MSLPAALKKQLSDTGVIPSEGLFGPKTLNLALKVRFERVFEFNPSMCPGPRAKLPDSAPRTRTDAP